MPMHKTLQRIVIASLLVAVPHASFAAYKIAGASSKSGAQSNMGIAAVVGDEAISYYDVESRVRFIIATARLSSTPDVLRVITPQVIRTLIDETVQMRAAQDMDIKISEEDIDQAVSAIEQQRGMPPGAIQEMLSFTGVPMGSFRRQIKAQLMWTQVLGRRVRPGVHVSEDEISIAARQFSIEPQQQQASVPQEYNIAVISLPVEKPEYEGRIKALAFKLVQQIRAGASFEEISRQFSSFSANTGGKVETFWVRPSQLDQAVAQSLAGATENTITNPVRSGAGYTIIKVYNTRDIPGYKPKKVKTPKQQPVMDTEVIFKEIVLKLQSDANEEDTGAMVQIGGEVAKNPGSCTDNGLGDVAQPENVNIEVAFKTYMLSEMPPGLKEFADELKIGEISPPVVTYEGVRLFMLCKKQIAPDKVVNRDLVYNRLMQQKLDLAAQKYLRDLRRETFIEIRE